MALSSSTNYIESYTAANVIERALKRLGVYDASETINSTEESDALVVLNLIVKEWTVRGADVWMRNTGHLFLPSPGTKDSYTVGTSGTATFTSQYYTTTLAAAVAAAGTALTVTDDTNMTANDVLLIEQDDGTLHETTISGTPSANSVTAAGGLASAAASGNIVYNWPTTDNITDKITKIIHASRRITNTDNAATNAGFMEGIDTPVNIIGEQEYRLLSTKLQTGVPVSLHHRQEPINPRIYLWPTGGSGRVHSIVIDFNSFIQDLDSTANNLDLSAEGANALVWNLAAELASEYGLPLNERQYLETKSESKINAFLDFQVEDAPVVFSRGIR